MKLSHHFELNDALTWELRGRSLADELATRAEEVLRRTRLLQTKGQTVTYYRVSVVNDKGLRFEVTLNFMKGAKKDANA